jgi:hypothetical protein
VVNELVIVPTCLAGEKACLFFNGKASALATRNVITRSRESLEMSDFSWCLKDSQHQPSRHLSLRFVTVLLSSRHSLVHIPITGLDS